jgi:tetratricopeptide (TPR) repeat protein
MQVSVVLRCDGIEASPRRLALRSAAPYSELMSRVASLPGPWRPVRSVAAAALLLAGLSEACHRDTAPNLEHADRLLAVGQNKQAIVEYQTALNVQPSAHAERGMGLAYEALGAFGEAQRHLESALEARPNDGEARVALARVHTHFGRYERARQQLLAALEQDPDLDAALDLIGVYAESRPQVQEAVDLLEARIGRRRQRGQALALESELVRADLVGRLNRPEAADKLRTESRYLPPENVHLLLELANAAQARDNFELARALSLALCERHPDQSDAWRALAGAALELGRSDEAASALQHIADRGKDPELRLLYARVELARGMETSGRTKLRALLAELPPDAVRMRSRVAGALAQALIAEREYEPAERELRALLEQDPHEPHGSLALADLVLAQGRAEQAVQIVSQLTDREGPLARVYQTLGRAQLAADRLDLAEQAFRRFWELAPQDPDARYRLALALRRRGQVDQARRLLEGNLKRFAAHAPSLSTLLELLEQGSGVKAAKTFLSAYGGEHAESAEVATLEAEWLLAHNDAEHALGAYRRALGADASFVPAVLGLSRFYARHGQPSVAESVIDAALARDPRSPALAVLAAALAEDLRRYDRGIDYAQKALTLNPQHPLLLAELGLLLAEGPRDLTQAKRYVSEAYAAAPSRPEVLDAFGWVLHLSGDSPAALGYLERAALAQPNEPQIAYHLGAALLAAGQTVGANEKFLRVLQLDPLFPAAPELRGLLARR